MVYYRQKENSEQINYIMSKLQPAAKILRYLNRLSI